MVDNMNGSRMVLSTVVTTVCTFELVGGATSKYWVSCFFGEELAGNRAEELAELRYLTRVVLRETVVPIIMDKK